MKIATNSQMGSKTKHHHHKSIVRIHTGLLFNPHEKTFEEDITIIVNRRTGLIEETYTREASRDSSESIQYGDIDLDLRHLVVLPGFVDAHTHIFLHPYAETPSLNQMRDESFVERVIRSVNHCRKALLAGYTTYRDLGTEGLEDADTHVRNAVNRGLIPGPRLYVATETIASSGGYAIRQENRLGGTSVPAIADVADGVDGVRAAVRRRLGAGADVIKFYADYRKRQLRFPPSNWPGAPPIQFPPPSRDRTNPNCVLFNQEEMDAIVAEAKAADCPVAAHAGSSRAVIMAAQAGVTTIEHGNEPSEDALRAMKEAGSIFVPTLAVMEQFYPKEDLASLLENTKRAWDMGIPLACGGDTGAFAHGDNAREMELMIQAGVPVTDVLTAATLQGWKACGGDQCGRRFGWLGQGCAADIIGLSCDPRSDVSALREVDFVMKDGRVWKQDGYSVGMVD